MTILAIYMQTSIFNFTTLSSKSPLKMSFDINLLYTNGNISEKALL